MSRSGARQWRLNCQHLENRQSDRCMHSEVSQRNVQYFPKEDRVTSDVTKSDLERYLEQAEAADDGHLVVCNECSRVKLVDDIMVQVLHHGRAQA